MPPIKHRMIYTERTNMLLNERPRISYGPPRSRPRARPYHPLLAQLESNACEASIKDYERELLVYFQELQQYDCPSAKMIDNQPELEWYMRPYLLDFLVDLHSALRLSEPVLFLAIQIMDRYSSKRIVHKKHYQLVTTTSLWIAAKFEDKKSRTPSLRQLVAACSNVYDTYMFVQMESHILNTLNWEVRTCFTTFDAIQLCFRETEMIWPCKDVSMLQIFSIFFAELSCYDKHYMEFSSSVRAASAIVLASVLLQDTSFQKHISYLLLDFSGLNCDDTFFSDPCRVNKESNDDDDDESNDMDDLFSVICAPLLKIDENTHIDIRRCCLLYLNDIFRPITSNKELPRALRAKYEKTCLQDYITSYTTHNIDTYLQLCKLTQALLNPIYDRRKLLDQINFVTDLMVGLELQRKTPVYEDHSIAAYKDTNSIVTSELQSEILEVDSNDSTYSSSSCNLNTSSSSAENRSPWTPASVFSATRSLSNVSSFDHEIDVIDSTIKKDNHSVSLPTPLRNCISLEFEPSI